MTSCGVFAHAQPSNLDSPCGHGVVVAATTAAPTHPPASLYIQATSGNKQRVELAPTDSLLGEASRIAVAEACVQALQQACTENHAYALASVEGDGPGQDAARWQQLFTACHPGGAGPASGGGKAAAKKPSSVAA